MLSTVQKQTETEYRTTLTSTGSCVLLLPWCFGMCCCACCFYPECHNTGGTVKCVKALKIYMSSDLYISYSFRLDPGNPRVQCQYSPDGWYPVWESRKCQLDCGLQGFDHHSPPDGTWQWGEKQAIDFCNIINMILLI